MKLIGIKLLHRGLTMNRPLVKTLACASLSIIGFSCMQRKTAFDADNRRMDAQQSSTPSSTPSIPNANVNSNFWDSLIAVPKTPNINGQKEGFISTFQSFYCRTMPIQQFPRQRSVQGLPSESLLEDIVNHVSPSQDINNQYYSDDKGTYAHESLHGIAASIRNSREINRSRKMNAFYLLNNRFVQLAEPRVQKSKVGSFVPPSLREYNYSLYVTGNPAWDNEPLYIYDEWSAYIYGIFSTLELMKRGLYRSQSDANIAFAQLEMAVYGIAVMMAVEKYDSGYFQSEVSFKAVSGCFLEETMRSFALGVAASKFPESTKEYLGKMQSNPDAGEMREFTKRFLGAEWAREVLGF